MRVRPTLLFSFLLWVEPCAGMLPADCQGEHVARYTTRGLVVGVDRGEQQTRLAVRHEALPAFEDRDGKLAPMPSMTMEFGLAPALETRVPALSSKLRFDFEVRWDTPPFLLITRIETLPADTMLSLPSEEPSLRAR